MKYIIGAWANTKYTRPVSSFILAIVFWGGFLSFNYSMDNPADLSIWIWASASVLFFPPARETYFRLTGPIRDGLSGIVLWGPLFLVALALRITIFVLLVFIAVPLGLLGFFYLATQEARGKGYRVIA
ncbi:hypothetical membrane protein [Glutamicibacter arilaitensis Re117]|uniref:Hypothetical membrane protein n=1 Tax=Glutamicibacter arilaitensis (strain DSM 16368 / CIP 108037 / IAM 15318 / JCM 13566 / NCIMB 14258 / Re117) TaxID=861360 RepID=A0ABM9Q0J2_GLUAR|nr:hypothetical protein [Glutamicibacter arilaitensis]CBT77230.1 hypothetical membrane protein [Glutamicibacter arilaitensis Re117]